MTCQQKNQFLLGVSLWKNPAFFSRLPSVIRIPFFFFPSGLLRFFVRSRLWKKFIPFLNHSNPDWAVSDGMRTGPEIEAGREKRSGRFEME
jgi:hypothetical protein